MSDAALVALINERGAELARLVADAEERGIEFRLLRNHIRQKSSEPAFTVELWRKL